MNEAASAAVTAQARVQRDATTASTAIAERLRDLPSGVHRRHVGPCRRPAARATSCLRVCCGFLREQCTGWRVK
jgi:hypothetical protein